MTLKKIRARWCFSPRSLPALQQPGIGAEEEQGARKPQYSRYLVNEAKCSESLIRADYLFFFFLFVCLFLAPRVRVCVCVREWTDLSLGHSL